MSPAPPTIACGTRSSVQRSVTLGIVADTASSTPRAARKPSGLVPSRAGREMSVSGTPLSPCLRCPLPRWRCLLFPGACPVVGQTEDGLEPGQPEPAVAPDQTPEALGDAGVDAGQASDDACSSGRLRGCSTAVRSRVSSTTGAKGRQKPWWLATRCSTRSQSSACAANGECSIMATLSSSCRPPRGVAGLPAGRARARDGRSRPGAISPGAPRRAMRPSRSISWNRGSALPTSCSLPASARSSARASGRPHFTAKSYAQLPTSSGGDEGYLLAGERASLRLGLHGTLGSGADLEAGLTRFPQMPSGRDDEDLLADLVRAALGALRDQTGDLPLLFVWPCAASR